MKYQGYSSVQIAETTGFSNPTIYLHIKNWNQQGLPATEERRGSGIPPKLEPFMVDDLLDAILFQSVFMQLILNILQANEITMTILAQKQ